MNVEIVQSRSKTTNQHYFVNYRTKLPSHHETHRTNLN